MSAADVTVVLVLKGREDFTPRWFDFHAVAGLSSPVVIGDGIPSDETGRLAGDFARKSGVPVDYMRFDERSLSDYYKKLYAIVERTSTKYVHFSANDDFIMPSGLALSAKFLDEHPEYVTYGGGVLGFVSVGPSFDLAFGPPKGEWCMYLSALYPALDIDAEQPVQRIVDYFGDYAPTYYAVHRRDDLLAALACLIERGIQDIRVTELFITMHLALRGKQALTLAYPGYLRQLNSSQTNSLLNEMRVVGQTADFFDSVVAGPIADDLRKLVGSLAEQANVADKDAFKIQINRALAGYYRSQFKAPAGWAGMRQALGRSLKSYAYTARAKLPFVGQVAQRWEWRRLKEVFKSNGATDQRIAAAVSEVRQALALSCGRST